MDHSIDQAIRTIIREELEISLKALLADLKSPREPAATTKKLPVTTSAPEPDVTPEPEVTPEPVAEAPKKPRAKKTVEAPKEEPKKKYEVEIETSELDDDTPEITNAGELLAQIKALCGKSSMPKPVAIKTATDTLEEEFGIKKFGDVPDDMLMEVYEKMKNVLA